MTEAFAIKDDKGEILALGLTMEQAWKQSLTRVVGDLDSLHSCVPVTVSEKGEADELLREVLDWGLPDDLKQRIDAHLARKEQK